MKSSFASLPALLMCLALLGPAIARAGQAEDDRLHAATDVLHQISEIPENAIPPELLANAYGIAVIPGVIKAGFVVGGAARCLTLNPRRQAAAPARSLEARLPEDVALGRAQQVRRAPLALRPAQAPHQRRRHPIHLAHH